MNKSTLLLISFIGLGLLTSGLSAQESLLNATQKESLSQLKKAHTVKQIKIDRNGMPSFLEGNLTPVEKGANLAETSFQFFNENRRLFRITEANEVFSFQKEQKDKLGMTHITLQQVYHKIPVWGKDMRLHYTREGQLKSVNGAFLPDIKVITTPTIELAIAGQNALKHAEGGKITQSQLFIFPTETSYKLAWKIEIVNTSPVARWDYFIDAANGEIIHRLNKIMEGDNKAPQTKKKPTLFTVPQHVKNVSKIHPDKQSQIAKTSVFGWNTILSEDFEGNFTENWLIAAGNADVYWGKSDCMSNSGDYSVWCAAEGSAAINCNQNYPDDMYTFMIYGPFSLADAQDAMFDFSYWTNTELEADVIYAAASMDGSGFYGTPFSGDSEGWESGSINLADYTGLNSVWIAFFFFSDGSINYPNGAFIDDLTISKFVNNSNPEGLTLQQLEATPNPVSFDQELNISARIRNNGPSSVSNAPVKFYLSANENLDTGDCYLGSIDLSLSVGNTANKSFTVDLSTIECLKSASNYICVYFENEDDAWFSEEQLVITSCNTPGGQIGSGIGVLGDEKLNINTICDGTIYRLKDVTRLEGEESLSVFESPEDFSSDILMADINNIWNSPDQGAGVDALVYSSYVSDYMQNEFVRNSWDDLGSSLISILNNNMAGPFNAFWDGEKINFGSGDPLSLAGALDVVAHEWGHAITEAESNLVYEKESGALNEAFSDMFGVSLGFAYNDPDWLMADDIYPGPFRDMENPHNYEQPEYYLDDPYWVDVVSCAPDGWNDYCGVHTNSGVPNKMFYLLSMGGTFHDITVDGIGIENAMQIMYRANAYYWSSSTTFWDAKLGTETAAQDLDNSGNWAEQVTNAWIAVGLTGEAPPPIEYCSGQSYLTAVSGTFGDGSGSSNNYENNSNCQWLIQPAGATFITLSFSEFNTEDGWDSVFVYDGPGSEYPLIVAHTGNSIPGDIISSGGSLYVVFISDNVVNASGWTAIYNSDGINPGLNLSAPNGGEIWYTGDTQTISWISDGSSQSVKIFLSTNGGANYNYSIVAATDDDGSLNWKIPHGINSASCRVKILPVSVSEFVDESNFNFTIIETAPVAVENSFTNTNCLYQNVPNPFTGITKIRFALATTTTVNLTIFNSAGLKIQELSSISYAAGTHEIEFDGTLLDEGIYYFKLESYEFVDVKKMIVIR